MYLLSVVVLSVTVPLIAATWISDLISPRGLSFGDGIFLKLEDTQAKNASFLERIAMRVDNENLGISMGQNAKKEAVELDFYVKDKIEGRSKKMGNMVVPFMMGAAGAGALSLVLGSIKVFIMKAMMLAKLALIFSMLILIGKLTKEQESVPRYVEVEQHAASENYPVYAEYPSGMSYSSPSASAAGGGYGGYAYNPSASESVINYATVEAPNSNGTVASVPVVHQVIPAAKRRDYRRRSRPMILAITHISDPDKGGLI